jgi:hypothetical protein
MKMNRRTFLQTSALAAAGAGLAARARADDAAIKPTADAMIMIWLPGGMAQTDLWDPKEYTPYRKGMKGSELLGTCKAIPTSADGIFLGEGLENIASVMHHGTILRSLSYDTRFGAVHLKAQYYMMTDTFFPRASKPPAWDRSWPARPDGAIRKCRPTFILGATSIRATRRSCSSASIWGRDFTGSTTLPS